MAKHRVICSGCGKLYHEWKHQDEEGNLCQACTVAVLRNTVKSYHKSIDLLCENMSPSKASAFRAMPFLTQRFIVESAFEEGILSWEINRTPTKN